MTSPQVTYILEDVYHCFERAKMMNGTKATAGVALIALGLPTLTLALSIGPAYASDVSATVETYDVCNWELAGIPDQISLGPVDGTAQPLPAGTKYIGEQMLLGGIYDLTMALTGRGDPTTGIANNSTDCSFYGDLKYPVVSATLDPAKPETFSATYVDSNGQTQTDSSLAVQLRPGNPLTASLYSPGLVGLTQGNPSGLTADDMQCLNSRIGSAKSIMRGHDPLAMHANTNKMIMWSTAVDVKYDAGLAPRCDISTLLMFFIPEATGTPDAAGREFTLAGPEVIYTLSTVDSAPATPVNPSHANYQAFTADQLLPYLP
jgi:hypothetical protein